MVCICQPTSQMCSSPQTWKSLASANGCRGWCICSKPATCKKGVAPCRCVSPTCAHVHLHNPTHFQKCMHFPLRRKECQQRYAHKIVHPCMCNCNAKKVCWLRGGVFVDVITFEIGLKVIMSWLRLHFWRLGGIPFPRGNMMEEWKLKHQVVQIYMNPSKSNLQNKQSLVL